MPAPSPTPAPYTLSNYEVLSSVGCGNSGTVHIVRPVASENLKNLHLPTCRNVQHVAKIIPHSKLTDATRREIQIHSSLEHPNIVTFHRVAAATPTSCNPLSSSSLSSSSSSNSSRHLALAILTEYASAGDMFTEVCSAGFLDAHTVRRRILHVASALQHLHQSHIVHLDVKLENVVLANDASAKLIDFGCARYLNQSNVIHATLGGTLQYLPPELVANPDAAPSPAMDAWSLGVLLYTALTGNYPFNAVHSRDQQPMEDHLAEPVIRNRILHCPPHPIPSYISLPADLQRLLSGLLQKDPAKRLTISQTLDILNESQRSSFALLNSRYQRRSPYLSRRFPQSSSLSSSVRNPPALPSHNMPQCFRCKKHPLSNALSIFDLVRSQNHPSILSKLESISNDMHVFKQDKSATATVSSPTSSSCQSRIRPLSPNSDTSSSTVSSKPVHV